MRKAIIIDVRQLNDTGSVGVMKKTYLKGYGGIP